MILRITLVLATFFANDLHAQSLTAARVIRAHAIIQPDDLAISSSTIPGALSGDADISGLEARVTLYPGRPIMPNQVGPAALVERNQTVKLIYRSGGLSIAAEARSLARGGEGDTVRVMNLDSRSVVVGQVLPDGSVKVASERSMN